MIQKNRSVTFFSNSVFLVLLIGLFSVLAGVWIGRGAGDSANVVILAVVFLPLLLFIVRQPHIGLGLTLASILIEFALPRLPFIGTTTTILGGITLAAFLGKRLVEGPKVLLSRRSGLYIFVIAFLGSALIGEILAQQISVERSWLFTYVQLAILTWLTIEMLQTRQQLLNVLRILLLGIFITVVNGLWQFANAALDTSFFRATGLVGNANAFSVYATVGVVIAYFFYQVEQTPIRRNLFLSVMILSIAAIIISGSRGGFLFLVVIMIFLVWRMARELGNRMKFTIFILAAFGALSMSLPDTYFDRILQIPQNILSQDDTVGTRLMLWEAGVRMWQTSPVFGVGGGAFAPLLLEYRPEGYLRNRATTAHNMYITILAENGIAGIVPFIGIIVFTIIILWRTEYRAAVVGDRHLVLLSVLAQTMLFIFLLNGGKGNWHYEKILWFLFGLAVVIGSLHPLLSANQTSSKRYGSVQRNGK